LEVLQYADIPSACPTETRKSYINMYTDNRELNKFSKMTWQSKCISNSRKI